MGCNVSRVVAQRNNKKKKYFLLSVVFLCHNAAMTTQPKPKTSAQTVRLPDPYWVMLRRLMQYHNGRAWLEKAIAREHKKIQAPE
jgi:hypothetical protein